MVFSIAFFHEILKMAVYKAMLGSTVIGSTLLR
jgi:hypothetical protein